MFSHTAKALAALALATVGLIFVSAWVAVSWHRHILLEEYPAMLPKVSGQPIWAYVWRGVLLVLVLILAFIPMGMIVGQVMLLGTQDGVASGLVNFLPGILGPLVNVLLSWIWLRLGLILPAAAVGRPITMVESWQKTAQFSGAIFASALILMAVDTAVIEALALVTPDNPASFALGLLFDWISIMVGVSILTTLYGVVIGGRSPG